MFHTTRLPLVVLLLATTLSVFTACATRVPATVTMSPRRPFAKGELIYLVARHHREVIFRTLIDAGLEPTNDAFQAEYDLTIRQGSSRGSSACGEVRNVSYVLTASGRRILIIKGRGATGDCDNSIYNDMSRKLASIASH